MSDLKVIKRHYGEDMAHFVRSNFSDILEHPGILSKIFVNNFAYNKQLYQDLIKDSKWLDIYNQDYVLTDKLKVFKDYIYGIYKNKYCRDIPLKEVESTPEELLKSVGYTLKETFSEEEIQSYKKYYAKGEELCTFLGDRLKRCRVFFAVKDNVDKIQRKDFLHPEREDLYGTSVISIQFDRSDACILSIKNRYNVAVDNPDATFDNNLDNIVPGLTYSFLKYYDLHQNYPKKFILPGYTASNDGKLYKVNVEINEVYFCSDNVIIHNGEVHEYPKEKFIIFDNCILDLVNKRLIAYMDEAFTNAHKDIEKIDIEKKEDNKKQVTLIFKDNTKALILLDENNNMLEYSNNYSTKLEDGFLAYNPSLKRVYFSNCLEVGDFVFDSCTSLEEIYLAKALVIKDNFASNANKLKYLFIPNVKEIGNSFCEHNESLEFVTLDNVEVIKDDFLPHGGKLKSLNLPKLTSVGKNFCSYVNLDEVNMPALTKAKRGFFRCSESINKINCESLKEIDTDSLLLLKNTNSINMPNLSSAKEDLFSSLRDLPSRVKSSYLIELFKDRKKKRFIESYLKYKNSQGVRK